MKTHTLLLAATALSTLAAVPAHAKDHEATSADQIAELREQMAALMARVDQLEGELEQAEAQAEAANTAAAEANAAAVAASETAIAAQKKADEAPKIAFKGTPEISTSGGWKFKPRGRLQYDTGFVNAPSSTGVDDGWGTDIRRARLGMAGDMPGGFGFKFEVDVANSDLAVTDAIISYEAGDVEISVGQFNNFQSLAELTSSLHTSFIERAAFTDAFGFVRRVGIGATYGKGDVLVQAGVFTDNMDELSNDEWSVDGRVVYMPKLGNAQLHLGGSLHYRELEEGATTRYRQRPLVAFTDERFINTDRFSANSETMYGLESAIISGPFHAVVEGHWNKVSRPNMFENPTFFGGYAEVGYFLTKGDTRGYKGGKFDRTKPVNPVGEGGIGSIQLNARYDRLDLTDSGVIGGTQDGYFLSLVWKPTDYTMLLANYGKLKYSDAVFPTGTGDVDYSVDVFGMRAQIDF
ncbi:hypothetical protein HUO12_02095 [Altererythrobacter sp. JGD-16]|uniref:Porin n=2 Tax=Altererythrobacter lutimaris TaxID=2743979 RepID=A0A850H9R0_9SPHN|nr:hypothetical protein [Altererythrobacter lutimaris]